MKRIGICGGIGSGKSQVAGILRAQGYRVMDTDAMAKGFFQVEKESFVVEARAGGLLPATELDDAELKELLQTSTALRRLLERRLHPKVLTAIVEIEADSTPSGLVFVESALIESHGLAPLFNAVIRVDASKDVAAARVAGREGVSPEKALQLLAMNSHGQADSSLSARFTAVVRNEGSIDDLPKAVHLAMTAVQRHFSAEIALAAELVSLAGKLVSADGGHLVMEAALGDVLRGAYAGPGRHYHDLSHLLYCLRLLDGLQAEVSSVRPGLLSEFVAALLFHDFVYDPVRKDNESRSAEISSGFMAEFIPCVDTRAVRGLIEATAMHGAAWSALSVTDLLFLDLDAAVLGGSQEEYERYSRGIMREFAPLCGMAAYRAGRQKFLAAMLAAPRLFHSRAFAGREAQAQTNIACELESLNQARST